MVEKICAAGIDVFTEGQGDRIIVMIHGWPDTYRLWDNQVEYLKKSFRCVRFSLPGFDIKKENKSYTLQEQIEIIDEIVDTVSPGNKVILMLHDWGCVFGYQYYLEHQDRVEKIIGVDVGDVGSKKMKLPFKAAVFVLFYQLWLAKAWLFRNSIGNWMTRNMAKLLKAPGDIKLIHAGMNYPYYQKWKHFFQGKNQGHKAFFPSCPMLFLYGTKKPVMFHSRDFVEDLNREDGSRAAALETRHWVMCDKPEEFNALVGEWLGI